MKVNILPKIKICGLKRLEDIQAVNEYKPDYIGFVFAGKKRNITPETAHMLKQNLLSEIKAVGVFVNADIEFILNLVLSGTIDIIQLHGDEDTEYISRLRKKTATPIIKAVRVKSVNDIYSCEKLPCDYMLLDTYVKDSYGGSGVTFDWSVIPKVGKPFFLAGGLTIENLANGARTNPYCLDISSGVETNGFKDKEKIKKAIEIVRSVK